MAAIVWVLVGCSPSPKLVTAPTPTLAPAGTAVSRISTTILDVPSPTLTVVDTPAPTTTSVAIESPTSSPLPSATLTPSIAATPSTVNSAATDGAKVAAAVPVVPTRVISFDVASRTPADAVSFLRGQLADYPDSGRTSVVDFSPSDILETMDTIVLDQVKQSEGDAALQKIYDVVANAVLATLKDEYGTQTVVVALDAGHGGKPGFFWDSGSNGTEAIHTRAVVQSILRQAQRPEYGTLMVRTIFNDTIADDLGMPVQWNRPTINQLLVRQARAAMLTQDTAAWNHDHPTAPRAVHEISIHFNAGAGGALVLNQGDTVHPEFQARSIDFGGKYLQRVIHDLNVTGLMPTPLRRWGATGLHDDVMMYRPAYINGLSLPTNFVPLYGMLQGHGYMPRYITILLAHV